MKLSDLARELDAGTIRPCYLVAGAEPLLRDDAVARIRAIVLQDGPEDFNLQRLRGDETGPADLRDAVNALPMMSARRLVILTDPEQGRSANSKAMLESLVDLVPELAAQQETVLVVRAAKADRRARWVKAFVDPSARIDCDPPKNTRETTTFVTQEAARQGLTLASGSAERLAERIGPQLLMLRKELEKVSLLAGEGVKITRAHVDEATCDVAEQPIWDLTDAIGEGRSADALALLGRIQAGGAPAPVVLGTLASHFRKLARARSGAKVPGPPFVVRKLERQASRYTPRRLVTCLDAIHQTDTAIKGAGTLAPSMAIERLVLGLAT